MKSGINQILLPVSVDNQFENAARFAFGLAKSNKASITALIIDDDSPWYETTLLPFHTKNLVSNDTKAEQSSLEANNEQIKCLYTIAEEMECTFSETIVKGHAATQILLQSRFHDVVILADNPIFADQHGAGARRVDPLLEILDQAIVPTILCGAEAETSLGSTAIYFDGSPFATLALHQVAYLYQSCPDEEITIRVSTFKEPTAKKLANQAAEYLKRKGLTNVSTQYSDRSPIDFARSCANDDTSMAVLGVRSRQAYHDFRIGALAHHFLEDEPTKNKLFC